MIADYRFPESIPNPVTADWLIDEWHRFRIAYNIRTQSDLADLARIDMRAWSWGVQLTNLLRMMISKYPQVAAYV